MTWAEVRGLALTAVMAVGLLALAVLVSGCAKEVPVEVRVPATEKPRECFVPRERVAPVPLIPTDPAARRQVCGAAPLSVCVSTLWSRHVLARDAAERRAEARRRVCAEYVQRI